MIRFHIKILSEVYSVVKQILSYLVICLFCFSFILDAEILRNVIKGSYIILFPIFLISFSQDVIRGYKNNGILESIATNISTNKILIDFYISLCLVFFATQLISAIIISILYEFNIVELFYLIYVSLLNLLLASAITVFNNVITAFFNKKVVFSYLFIMPLIIPNLILSGISICDVSNYYNYLLIILGLNLILIPFLYLLSSYIFKDIYKV